MKIVISKGKQTVTLPNVTGQSESVATQTIQQLELKVRTETEYNSYVAAGMVLRQSPDPQSEVMPGSEVVLTLSLGPAPEPSSASPSESTTEASEPLPEPSSSDSSDNDKDGEEENP